MWAPSRRSRSRRAARRAEPLGLAPKRFGAQARVPRGDVPILRNVELEQRRRAVEVRTDGEVDHAERAYDIVAALQLPVEHGKEPGEPRMRIGDDARVVAGLLQDVGLDVKPQRGCRSRPRHPRPTRTTIDRRRRCLVSAPSSPRSGCSVAGSRIAGSFPRRRPSSSAPGPCRSGPSRGGRGCGSRPCADHAPPSRADAELGRRRRTLRAWGVRMS